MSRSDIGVGQASRAAALPPDRRPRSAVIRRDGATRSADGDLSYRLAAFGLRGDFLAPLPCRALTG